MIRSLFGKIFTSHIIIIIIITASIGIVLSHLITEYLIEAKRTELIHEGIVSTRFLETALDDPNNLKKNLEVMSELSGVKMWVLTRDDTIIGDAPMSWHHRLQMHKEHGQNQCDAPPPPPRRHPLEKIDIRAELAKGEPLSWIKKARNEDDPSVVVAVPFSQNEQTALFLHAPILGITKTAVAIQKLLVYSIITSIALAALCAFFVSRNLTKPIRNISDAAQSFAKGNYTSRTIATGIDEIGNLGQTFNQMATALENIEKNRREFFSNVAHELKTPIAAIQALTETMIDGLVPSVEKRNRYLQTILNETNHMNHLISELLDLERLESGQFSFQYKTIALKDFLINIKEKYAVLLQIKQLSFTLQYAPTLKTLHTDPNRLEQILTNLLSNAIRHSPENSVITIQVIFDLQYTTFTVTDHGEGIPAAHLPFIWDRFYRVDKARSRSEGGTGLGLAITKKLVEGMNGTIQVTSIPFKETVFSIKLPNV